jgi:hypothetical protein
MTNPKSIWSRHWTKCSACGGTGRKIYAENEGR